MPELKPCKCNGEGYIQAKLFRYVVTCIFCGRKCQRWHGFATKSIFRARKEAIELWNRREG